MFEYFRKQPSCMYISGPENHNVVYFRSIRSQKLTKKRILYPITIL